MPIDPGSGVVEIEGSLPTADDEDWYSFSASDQRLWAYVDTSGSDTDGAAFLRLYNDVPAYIWFGHLSGTSNGGDSSIESMNGLGFRADVDGDHYIQITEHGQDVALDSYRMFAVLTDRNPRAEIEAANEVDGNDSIETAESLVAPTGVIGYVEGALPDVFGQNDSDYFSIVAQAGEKIAFFWESRGFGADLKLWDSEGNLLIRRRTTL
jgi:hypothetical protein